MTARSTFRLGLALLVPALVSAQDAPPLLARPATAATAPAEGPAADLKALVAQIRAKLGGGQRPTAATLAPELAAFDALLAKYRDQRTDEVAQILYMQATLYGEVLEDADKMKALLTQLKADFPGTRGAGVADQTLASLAKRAAAKETAAALVGQPAPELHFTWSTQPSLQTLSALKGKVVVLDFWATWCGPCVASFPQIRELAAHYRDMAVAVVGVTSIQGSITGLQTRPVDTRGDPQKEFALMADYIKAKDITWTVAFSEEEVFNPDYGITGIPHMAIVAPDGTVRHTGLHPGALSLTAKVELIDAILKEFKLPVLATAPNR